MALADAPTCRDSPQPLNLASPDQSWHDDSTRGAVVFGERFSIHLERQDDVLARIHRRRSRDGRLVWRTFIVRVTSLEYDVLDVFALHSCERQHVAQTNPRPCRVAHSPCLPLQPLDRTMVAHVTASIAGTLHGCRDRDDVKACLHLAYTHVHGSPYTNPVDGDRIYWLGNRQMIAHEEERRRRDEVIDQQLGRGLGIERASRVDAKDGRASWFVGEDLLAIGVPRRSLGHVVRMHVADSQLLQLLIDVRGVMDSVEVPERFDGATRCQHDLLVSRMLGHEVGDVVDAFAKRHPHAG